MADKSKQQSPSDDKTIDISKDKPGNDKMGFILTTVLCIVGAFVGSYIGQALGIYHVGESAGLIGATLGAILILVLLGAVSKRRYT